MLAKIELFSKISNLSLIKLADIQLSIRLIQVKPTTMSTIIILMSKITNKKKTRSKTQKNSSN